LARQAAAGAHQYAKAYRLEPSGDATVVRTSACAPGGIDSEMLAGQRKGGQVPLESLKNCVEQGAPRRPDRAYDP
jgi:hypothetical protein